MAQTIWWCDFSNAGVLGNVECPTLPSLPGLIWPRVVAPDRVLSIRQIELNCELVPLWIAWNRTVLTIVNKNYTYT